MRQLKTSCTSRFTAELLWNPAQTALSRQRHLCWEQWAPRTVTTRANISQARAVLSQGLSFSSTAALSTPTSSSLNTSNHWSGLHLWNSLSSRIIHERINFMTPFEIFPPTQHSSLVIHTNGCIHQYFVPLYCRAVFHGVAVSHRNVIFT